MLRVANRNYFYVGVYTFVLLLSILNCSYGTGYLHGVIYDQRDNHIINNVTVKVYTSDNMLIIEKDVSGNFTIPVPPSDNYYILNVEVFGYWPSNLSGIKINENKTSQIELGLAPKEMIELRGRVSDEDGKPINNAMVRLTSGLATVETSTDAQGSFVVQVPKGIKYRLYISKSGYEDYVVKNFYPELNNDNTYVLKSKPEPADSEIETKNKKDGNRQTNITQSINSSANHSNTSSSSQNPGGQDSQDNIAMFLLMFGLILIIFILIGILFAVILVKRKKKFKSQ